MGQETEGRKQPAYNASTGAIRFDKTADAQSLQTAGTSQRSIRQ